MSSLLTTALSIVSIATLAGLGLLRGVVTNLREQLKDARDELAVQKAGRADDRAELTVCRSDLTALTKVVTGEVHWKAIEETVDALTALTKEHHRIAQEHWAKDEELLEQIIDALRRQP